MRGTRNWRRKTAYSGQASESVAVFKSDKGFSLLVLNVIESTIQVRGRPKFAVSEGGSRRDAFLGVGLQINKASRYNFELGLLVSSGHTGEGRRLQGVS